MENKKLHILVVDDDDRIRSLLKDYLSNNDYIVSTAENADQAKSKLEILKFDIIILDVMMPGQDGYELTKEIKKKSKIPIILLTAKGEVENRIKGLELGADDYMKKPIDRTFLINIVKRYITEKNQKVLIVDDDENTRDLLNKILKNEGYMSIDAKNGEDALERVKEKPDLIVLDLDMPRMDGFEFIEKTQEDGIKIPIVVFSGKDITAVEEKMLSKFTEGIVKKESKVDTLVQEVNQILKGENPK